MKFGWNKIECVEVERFWFFFASDSISGIKKKKKNVKILKKKNQQKNNENILNVAKSLHDE